MSYNNLPPSKPAPRRVKTDLIFGVGRHAFVHCPLHHTQLGRGVPLIDGSGRLLDNDLADGQEVEIVAWRPRSRDGLAYQVRRLSDGTEWWIPALYLRRGRDAPTAPADEQR